MCKLSSMCGMSTDASCCSPSFMKEVTSRAAAVATADSTVAEVACATVAVFAGSPTAATIRSVGSVRAAAGARWTNACRHKRARVARGLRTAPGLGAAAVRAARRLVRAAEASAERGA